MRPIVLEAHIVPGDSASPEAVAHLESIMSDPEKDTEMPVEDLDYETAYQELETIVAALEAEENPLEAALTLFERGQALARHCAGLLEKAELRVGKLEGDEIVEMDL